jgi:hypothetical protein
MGYLKLRIEPDGDGTAELFAEFETKGFSGRGSAWFDLQTLASKAEKFGQYPLPSEPHVCIEGGYWTEDHFSKLAEEHLHLSAYPINSRGGIRLKIRVASSLGGNARPQSQCYAGAEISTEYEQLARFSRELASLARGETNEVVLNELALGQGEL